MSTVRPLVSPLLVGRDDLVALADRRIAEVAGGTGHLILIAGEPGIGKTRLLRTVLDTARTAGFRVAKGDLSPQDRLVVLASLHDLARTMSATDFGGLGQQILDVDRAQGPDSLGSRRSLVRDLVEVILAAIDRPTVLAFEDLQWADDMTLEVVAELARGSGDRPLLMVGVYRIDELPAGSVHREWRSRLLTQRIAEEIRVQRLSREETGLVTTMLLGTGLPAPREVVDAVHERTNGIPLHIEELLAAVGDGTGDSGAFRTAHVPDTIEDAILAHASRLSPAARAAARAGAVMGRCFAPEVLAGIMDLPLSELDEPLDELVRGGILFPFEQVDEGYYDFRHQLLRDALYGDVPARDLRRFHARAAEFGTALIGTTDASLHFERAGLREQAFRAALASAHEARRVYSHGEAFDLLRRAVQNIPAGLPDPEQAAVWMALSNTAADVDRNDVCRDAAMRCRQLALRAGDSARAAEALLNVAAVMRRECESIVERRDLGRRVSLEVERLPEGQMRRTLHVTALMDLGLVELDDCRFGEARGYFDEAREAALLGDMHEEVRIIGQYLAGADLVETGATAALEMLGDDAEAARAEGHETRAVNSYRDAGWYAVRSFEYRRARPQLAQGLRYAEEIEQSFCGHMIASTQAIVSWAEGRWADATAEAGQAASDQGSARARAAAHWVLGWIAAGRAERTEAEAHLEPALELGRRAGWLEFVLPAQWGLAEAALMAGDPVAAIRLCEDALRQARQKGEQGLLTPFVVTGVRAYQLVNQPNEGARWLGRITRAIGPLATVAAPAIEHGRGLVKLSEGAPVAAREHLATAVGAWDERGRRWEALWARLDLGAANLRSNRFAEAMVLVREVGTAAEELRSSPLLDRVEHLTRVARGRGTHIEAWHPLTVREFEVARKIAEGLTNAAIAEGLSVSPKTVSAHVEHILTKLGASRRAEIAAWVTTVA